LHDEPARTTVSAPRPRAIEEAAHQRCDLLALGLESEVAGIEQMELGVGQVGPRVAACGNRDKVAACRRVPGQRGQR